MAVLIKRYANRKLYNTQTSRYITLKGIAELLENDQEVKVIDNETGEDITSVTLSQILVDTERANRAVGDASDGIEEFQRNVRRLLGAQGEGRREWIAFTPPDLDELLQKTVERVFRALDLPRRSDVEALNQRLDRVAQVLESVERRQAAATSPTPPHATRADDTEH
jgi:hypothetical protein